ncbi:MAG: type II toxin-antitoxin system HipA family toxin [Gallionella sp.]
MSKKVEVIKVYIWDKYVGAVALDPNIGHYAFEYDHKFITTGIELAPMAMPLARANAPFIFPTLPELTYKRLPAMLSDALPDDFGNNLIDAWMAERGIPKSAVTPLDRLAYMGRRGMGALEFKPAKGSQTSSANAIKMSKLVENARLAINGDFNTDNHSKAALSQLIQVGTSAGGARAKATIAWNPASKEIRAGQFDVEPGFEHWLLKLDVGKDTELGESKNFGRIEYAYYLMATAAGISMTDCRLLEENGRAHFMTKRFDRDGNTKHHMASLCAMSHLDYKQVATHDYAQLFLAINQLGLGQDASEEAFRRMVFNVLAVNCDDHSKNFSFMLREKGKWELSPAYDLTHTYKPGNQWVSQHLSSVGGVFAGAGRSALLELADRFLIGRAKKIIKQVEEVVTAWPDFAAKAKLPQLETKAIGEQFKNRPV